MMIDVENWSGEPFRQFLPRTFSVGAIHVDRRELTVRQGIGTTKRSVPDKCLQGTGNRIGIDCEGIDAQCSQATGQGNLRPDAVTIRPAVSEHHHALSAQISHHLGETGSMFWKKSFFHLGTMNEIKRFKIDVQPKLES